jgi:Helix-turn-helix domain
MNDLSSGARRCLFLLRSFAGKTGRAFPYQRTIADKLGVEPRMVRYYLAELKACGLVEKVLKRQHSSAEYCLSDCRSDCRSGSSTPITELKPITSDKLGRKPPTVEIPEECLRNEYGRVSLNPAFLRYRDLAATERVRRARDPVRYLAAIWAQERLKA